MAGEVDGVSPWGFGVLGHATLSSSFSCQSSLAGVQEAVSSPNFSKDEAVKSSLTAISMM